MEFLLGSSAWFFTVKSDNSLASSLAIWVFTDLEWSVNETVTLEKVIDILLSDSIGETLQLQAWFFVEVSTFSVLVLSNILGFQLRCWEKWIYICVWVNSNIDFLSIDISLSKGVENALININAELNNWSLFWWSVKVRDKHDTVHGESLEEILYVFLVVTIQISKQKISTSRIILGCSFWVLTFHDCFWIY